RAPQRGDHFLAQPFPLREAEQPAQPLAGEEDYQVEPAGVQVAKPGDDRGGIGRVEDVDHRIAQCGRAFFLQHLGQLFKLPALRQGDRATFEGIGHEVCYPTLSNNLLTNYSTIFYVHLFPGRFLLDTRNDTRYTYKSGRGVFTAPAVNTATTL